MKAPTHGDVLEFPVDGRLRALLGAHIETGTVHPVEPRDAATVMLVRGGPREPAGQGAVAAAAVEVFMLRRASSMAFAPDAIVFPGGTVDARDADPGLPWAGPSPQEWARRMCCAQDTARRVVVAAAREVFEETGVLLAGPTSSSVLGDLRHGGWAGERDRLASHEESFAGMLIRRELVLRTDLMGLRSNWLTPEFEPKRYDTYFFAALAPAGQIPDAQTSEAVGGRWVQPERMLQEAAAGDLLLLPPTAYNLQLLAQAGTAERFVLECPEVARIMLAPKIRADGQMVLWCTLP